MEQRSTIVEPDEPFEGNYFVSAYPPFSCWSENAIEPFRRALRQCRKPPDDSTFGLYIHIPFCVQRCRYCYYLSYDDKFQAIDAYLEAVARELALYAQTPALAGREVSFVYFGGGTPSLLSALRIRRLLRNLQGTIAWTAAQEVTFECAPKSVAAEKLRALREFGVTRLSLGVQQFDDEVLRRNGRVHLVRDVERAYETIRRVGFDVVNIDLMVGMLGETDETVNRSLDRVISLGPESVTIYQLEMPLNTPLYRDFRQGKVDGPLPPWPVKRERLARGLARLEAAGYTVRSAYAAVRDPVRHRFVYQEDQYRGADLLGVGVSSFSYLAGVHQQNRASLPEYLERVSDGGLPLWRAYPLTDEERLVREFVLQLKLGRVETGSFFRKFGVDVVEWFSGPLQACEERGWLSVGPEAVTLTRKGLLRVDRMIPAFYLPEHRGVRYS